MKKVVLATGNAGKLREMREILAPLSMEVVAQTDYDFTEVEETGLSFVENALLKARHACLHTGLPAIADDSGLEVDALNGAPGIYSARYSGPDATDADNNRELLSALDGLSADQRSARFQCLMVFMRHAEDPTPLISQGTWEGRILEGPRGESGFGYDPLFLIPDRNQTSAELAPEVKNQLSHRGRALQGLLEKIQARYSLNQAN